MALLVNGLVEQHGLAGLCSYVFKKLFLVSIIQILERYQSNTWKDYMHLTKRFGIVAASQLPLHYLLSVKTPYSPLQLILRGSHETLNSVHQVLGRVILSFLLLHASFYLNFFIRLGVLSKRASELDVIMGLASITTFSVIGISTFGIFRRSNYRVFYSIHVVGSSLVLMLLFFHVVHVRIFVFECGVIQLLNIFTRFLNTKRLPVELKPIAETSLVQLTSNSIARVPIWKPGQHFYLRFAPPGLISYLRGNPFTATTLPGDPSITLVARTLGGHTQRLAFIANNSIGASSQTPLYFEGPYGHSKYLPNFIEFDRILLVAGGIGATYIIPLWKSISQQRLGRPNAESEARLVWSVRGINDAAWSFGLLKGISDKQFGHDELELHITTASPSSGDVQLRGRAIDEQGRQAKDVGFAVKYGRPDLHRIVEEVFASHDGRVAVLVCGPKGMTTQLRGNVGKWVAAGRDVWWHAEEFGL
jgi:NAD(P)H-flavin reductase